LSDDSVRDDVTSSGRLFHVLAAVMGNARLPVLPSRVAKSCWILMVQQYTLQSIQSFM